SSTTWWPIPTRCTTSPEHSRSSRRSSPTSSPRCATVAARRAARWNARTPPVHDDRVVSVGPDDVARITPLAVAPRAELYERGRIERHEVHRRDHGDWTPAPDRRSPLEILAESNATREPEL